jgi:hypothetical protein
VQFRVFYVHLENDPVKRESVGGTEGSHFAVQCLRFFNDKDEMRMMRKHIWWHGKIAFCSFLLYSLENIKHEDGRGKEVSEDSIEMSLWEISISSSSWPFPFNV